MLQEMDPAEHRAVFSTTSHEQAGDSYFLESGDKIRFPIGQITSPRSLGHGPGAAQGRILLRRGGAQGSLLSRVRG